MGAPGADMEARRGISVEVGAGRRLATCSAEEGVETDKDDDDELDDEDIIGMCDVVTPLVAVPVVLLAIASVSVNCSSGVC
jgi:hypothetical protein